MIARLLHRPPLRRTLLCTRVRLPPLRRNASSWPSRFTSSVRNIWIPSIRNIRIPSVKDVVTAIRSTTLNDLRAISFWLLRSLNYAILFFITYHIFITHFFVLGPVYGISMLPTFNDEGDWVVTSAHYRRGRDLQVGDLVTFTHPLRADTQSLKRVLGLPGDFVLRDTPGTSGVLQRVPEGHCWVAGDNLRWSRDSRMFGPLPLGLVRGKVVLRKAAGEWRFRSLREPWAEPEVD